MYPSRIIVPVTLSTIDQAFHEAHLQISQMSTDILIKLNTNPSELTNFIQTLPTIKNIKIKHQQLLKHNRQLAENNLKKEPELINLRKNLLNLFPELLLLRNKYYQIRSKDQESLSSILFQLQSMVHTNEQSNEKLIDTFIHTNSKDNNNNIDIFIKNFLRDRQETIELRFISEKFSHLYQIEKNKNKNIFI